MLIWLKNRINERRAADDVWADGIVSWIAHLRSIDDRAAKDRAHIPLNRDSPSGPPALAQSSSGDREPAPSWDVVTGGSLCANSSGSS